MAGMVAKKLGELGITLGNPAAPSANYIPFVRTGNLLMISGQICFDSQGKLVAKGQLGGGCPQHSRRRRLAARCGHGGRGAVRSVLMVEHDLFGKPAATFPDHALVPSLDWLTAKPIAHRGLHDTARGLIENTAGAVRAAVDAGYGIEVDLQISADGEAMVHHDAELGRLTEGRDRLDQLSAAALKRIAFRDSDEHMMTLGELCELVDGRVPIFSN